MLQDQTRSVHLKKAYGRLEKTKFFWKTRKRKLMNRTEETWNQPTFFSFIFSDKTCIKTAMCSFENQETLWYKNNWAEKNFRCVNVSKKFPRNRFENLMREIGDFLSNWRFFSKRKFWQFLLSKTIPVNRKDMHACTIFRF